MVKLIVFDWNGTLLSDVYECMEADNLVLKAFGGKTVDIRTYRDTIVVPVIHFYVAQGCSRQKIAQDSQKASNIFFKKYKELADKTTLRKGTTELLQWLQSHSIEAIILSNHSPEGIHYHLDRFGIAKYFSDILADVGDSSLIKQEKGERLKKYLHQRDFSPSNAAIIGDTAEEAEIGKSLGMLTVAITGGYFSESRLKKADPDYLVHDLRELRDIVEQTQ